MPLVILDNLSTMINIHTIGTIFYLSYHYIQQKLGLQENIHIHFHTHQYFTISEKLTQQHNLTLVLEQSNENPDANMKIINIYENWFPLFPYYSCLLSCILSPILINDIFNTSFIILQTSFQNTRIFNSAPVKT